MQQSPAYGLAPGASWWCCAWCTAAVFLVARVACAETEVLSDHHVRIRAASAAEAKQWKRLVAACISEVDSVMGDGGSPEAMLSLRVGESRPSAAMPDPLRVYAGPDDPLLCVVHGLAKGLIGRRVMTSADGEMPVLPSLDWIGAAVVHRLLFGNRESRGFFEPDYQPARHVFASGHFPDVERLLTGSIPPCQPRLFRLYALHCDILLLALQSIPEIGESVPRRLLELEAFGRESIQGLSFLLSPRLTEGGGLQSWYEKAAVDVSRRGRRQSRVHTVEARLHELITVPMVAPSDRGFAVTRVPVEDVPEKLDAYRLDKQALRNVQADLFELLKDSPALLQEPLGRYMEAFEALAEGKIWRFKRRLRKAHTEFDERARRQSRVEDALDATEQQAIPADRRFGDYLDVIEQYKQRQRRLDPELHRYLDSFGG